MFAHGARDSSSTSQLYELKPLAIVSLWNSLLSFSGTWSTPGYPKHYLDLITCNVSISAPAGYVIELEFSSFSLEPAKSSPPDSNDRYVNVTYFKSTSDIALIENMQWEQIESHQNGVATHSGATPLISMTAILLASSQRWLCVDADTWCKRVRSLVFSAHSHLTIVYYPLQKQTLINESFGSLCSVFCVIVQILLQKHWKYFQLKALKAFHFQRRLALIIIFTHRLTLTSVTKIIYYDVCKIKFIGGSGCWRS